MLAADEPGPDLGKAIAQRHLENGIRDVPAGKRVMQQTVATHAGDAADDPAVLLRQLEATVRHGCRRATALSAIALVTAAITLVLAIVR